MIRRYCVKGMIYTIMIIDIFQINNSWSIFSDFCKANFSFEYSIGQVTFDFKLIRTWISTMVKLLRSLFEIFQVFPRHLVRQLSEAIWPIRFLADQQGSKVIWICVTDIFEITVAKSSALDVKHFGSKTSVCCITGCRSQNPFSISREGKPCFKARLVQEWGRNVINRFRAAVTAQFRNVILESEDNVTSLVCAMTN